MSTPSEVRELIDRLAGNIYDAYYGIEHSGPAYSGEQGWTAARFLARNLLRKGRRKAGLGALPHCDVHEIIQTAFGWADSHLHRFGCGPAYYSDDTSRRAGWRRFYPTGRSPVTSPPLSAVYAGRSISTSGRPRTPTMTSGS